MKMRKIRQKHNRYIYSIQYNRYSILSIDISINYLVTLSILHQLKVMPCFLIEVEILPVISIVVDLCCNLNEPSFICENCWNSASNGATIVCSCREAQKFCPLSTLQVTSIKWVDVYAECDFVWWSQGWNCGHKIVASNRCSNCNQKRYLSILMKKLMEYLKLLKKSIFEIILIFFFVCHMCVT